MLQAGDAKAAEREFTRDPEAGAGVLSRGSGPRLCRRWRAGTRSGALRTSTRRSPRNAAYAPALAGKGEALLALGPHRRRALEAFEAALAADPGLTALRGRVDVLKFRGAQQNIESARKAAEAGKLDEARRGYLAAIAASPESAFLYRELAAVEQQVGRQRSGAVARRAGGDTRSRGRARADARRRDLRRPTATWAKAADAYTAVNAVEPGDATAAKIDLMREKAAFDGDARGVPLDRDLADRHAGAAGGAARRPARALLRRAAPATRSS